MSEVMFHLLILDSLNNKELIQYLISLDGEVVLANCSITGPERCYTCLDYFKRYICQKLDLIYEKSFLDTILK